MNRRKKFKVGDQVIVRSTGFETEIIDTVKGLHRITYKIKGHKESNTGGCNCYFFNELKKRL